jgi:alkaline phosphatase D
MAMAAVVGVCAAAGAQHDAWRNTVRTLAKGRPAKAGRAIERGVASGDPEWRYVAALAACIEKDANAALAHARAAVEAGLPLERIQAGPRDALAPLYRLPAYRRWAQERGAVLLHGPLLGCVTDTSARFWGRTARAATVTVAVRPAGDDAPPEPLTASATTAAEADYTGVVSVEGLRPDTPYTYRLRIDDKPVGEAAAFRTYPRRGAAGQFLVGFGGGAGYVPEHERMWNLVAERAPLAFLMLGDNVYIDDPEHPLTQRYCYYRRQSRPEWRRFAAGSSVYAVYDDHDFGTNDCVPGPRVDDPAWKRPVWEVFRQNWNNPSYGGGAARPGCWHDVHIGDVHFILLDGRYYRDLKGGSMLGAAQKAWLIKTLKGSRGTFKVLASPVPWSRGVKPGSRDTWDGFPEEREEIFSVIEKNRIEGVLLISADRHRSDIRVIRRPNGYDLREFESSRLTNRHTHGVVKTPGLIYGYNKTCSVAMMAFDTTADDPTVEFRIVDIEGTVQYCMALRRSALGFDAAGAEADR